MYCYFWVLYSFWEKKHKLTEDNKAYSHSRTEKKVWRHCWIIYKVIITYFRAKKTHICDLKLPWVKVKWNTCYSHSYDLAGSRSSENKRISKEYHPKIEWVQRKHFIYASFGFCFSIVRSVFFGAYLRSCWMHLPWITMR